MANILVMYQSKYGATQKYAEWLDEIQIGRVYDKKKDKIESDIIGFSFNGFEPLHKLTKDIEFNDTGRFKI